jgi:SAM-dependent methyltransferase
MRADAHPTFAELMRPLPPISPRAWRFAVARAASRGGALLSDGLRIGWSRGFDSGPFMAHVYANDARGRTPLGRAIDRRLLERRTCVAFRDIRGLAQQAVLDAIDAADSPEPVVADLAAGPATYLVRALAERPRAVALACDIDPAALDTARRAAIEAGVGDQVATIQADAFDRAALAALGQPGAQRPPTAHRPLPTGRGPDVVIELGLYGIYHDDARIERHFHDLAELVAPRQIVFNVQTRNPEIEHIARVWRNAAGERCIWRLRPLEQILEYAAAAGYEPAHTTADRYGIYRVVRLTRGEA